MPSKRIVSKMKKQPIPEDATLGARELRDFELSDDEPKMVSLNKEQKLTSKNIIFDCPLCYGKLQLRNEIEINPKGIICRCNPCSFKITKNGKSMDVSKNDEGGITLEREDHSISFSFNRITTPPIEDEANRNQMISDVMKTPRSNKKKQNTLNDLE